MQFILRNDKVKAAAVKAVQEASTDPSAEVIVRPYKERRSLKQNKLFHHLCRDVSEQYALTYGVWYSPKSWKLYFKHLFLGDDPVLMPNGKVGFHDISTTDLTVERMQNFIDKVLAFATTGDNNEEGLGLEIRLRADEELL